jgi:hypothetical protein
MADINSSLPVRTQAAGDVSVKTDQTTHGTTDLVAADVVKISGTAAVTGNGVTGAGSQRVTIASDNTPYAVKTDQTTHGTTDLVADDVVKIGGTTVLTGNGVTGAGSQRVTIASDNSPIPVTFGAAVLTGEVISYDTSSAVAAAGTDNHDYTVTGGKTFLLSSVQASASGKMKVEVIYDPTGTPLTLGVFFVSTATPNFTFELAKPFEAAATKVIRVARTNLESVAMDVYSTVNGIEV